MIREMFYHDQKAVPAIYSAKTAMTTGMGVQVDFTKNEVAVPSADDTVDGIFFVDHEFSPEGLKASLTNIDDYDEDAVAIKEGELVKLIAPEVGEMYGTDQYVATDVAETNKGKRMAVGTDGKWKLATTAASRFILADVQKDGVHTLAWISVAPEAKTNA